MGFVRLEHRLNIIPVLLFTRPHIGKHNVPILVFWGNYKDGDFLPDMQVFTLLIRDLLKFSARDHPLRFRTNTDQDFIISDGGYCALAYLTLIG